MSRKLVTQVEIDASSEVVWQILTDFDQFIDWNPFIRSIRGEPKKGARLQAQIQPSGGNAMTFRPIVLIAEPERELRWLGRFLFPGVFDGEHCFRIEVLNDRRVRVIHSEVFSGVLVPLLWRTFLDQRTRQGFEAMNRALKNRAEHYISA